jgi:hypothetical protein
MRKVSMLPAELGFSHDRLHTRYTLRMVGQFILAAALTWLVWYVSRHFRRQLREGLPNGPKPPITWQSAPKTYAFIVTGMMLVLGLALTASVWLWIALWMGLPPTQ